MTLNIPKLSELFFLLPLIFLNGCSSITVHVNDYNLQRDSLEKLIKGLSKLEVDVKIISLEPPSDFKKSKVISGSRTIINNSIYDELKEELIALGYTDVEYEYIQSGNHWYRDFNIGLYLIDSDIDSDPKRKVVGEYKPQNCESMTSLILHENMDFTVEYSNKKKLSGVWGIDAMPYVKLSNKAGLNFYYRVEFDAQADQLVKFYIVRLHPLDDQSQIRDCLFIKKKKQSELS